MGSAEEVNSLKSKSFFARLDLNKEEQERDFLLRKQLSETYKLNTGKVYKIQKGKIVEVEWKNVHFGQNLG